MPRNSPLRAAIPRLPRLPGGSTLSRPQGYAGAVRIPRARLTQESFRPYPDPPSWFTGSLPEWVCIWWLQSKKRLRINVDFFYQAAVPFAFNIKGFSRADILIPSGYFGKAPIPSSYRGLVWDPLNPFSHPNASRDRLKKQVFGQHRYLLVWIETAQIVTNPNYVLELAWRGIDVSGRARGR